MTFLVSLQRAGCGASGASLSRMEVLVYLDRPIGVDVAIFVVDVALKPEILDPQGRAVLGALGRLGLTSVAEVRQGKQFLLAFDGEVDEAKLAQINEIALTLLSNPVIENFTVQVRP